MTVKRGKSMKRLILAATAVAMILAGSSTSIAGEPAAHNVWKFYTVESPSTGKIERFWVGHPATIKDGPAKAGDTTYPVIYFLPGLRDNDDTWKSALDPHLAEYKIIAICPSVGGATWFMNSPRQPWMKWGDYLTQDLRGFVESRYPASPKKGQRGLCGISAGGHAAFYQALTHPDLYGAVSVLSGAMDLRGYAGAVGLDYWIGPRTGDVFQQYVDRSCVVLAARHEGPLPFELSLDAGDTDGALPQMQTLAKVLDAKKLPYKWFVGKGSHSWTYWNGRAADHLAWFDDQFTRNRRGNLMSDKSPLAEAPALKILDRLPDVSLSDATEKRLRAAWMPPTGGRTMIVNGIPKDGGTISKIEPKPKDFAPRCVLGTAGRASGVFGYALTITAVVPGEGGGTLALQTFIRTEQDSGLFSLSSVVFDVPAGPANRSVELTARLMVELKSPDPMRGGIAAGMQAFTADGKPAGQPATGSIQPGTLLIEQWPFGATPRADWVFTLSGDKALPAVTIKDIKVEVEP
jgi:S-formylglutathione hydrolase FrmB